VDRRVREQARGTPGLRAGVRSSLLYQALEMTDEGSSGSRLASENDVADLRPRQLLPHDMKAPLGHPR
jgi:hypothetical protein